MRVWPRVKKSKIKRKIKIRKMIKSKIQSKSRINARAEASPSLNLVHFRKKGKFPCL